MFENQVVPRLEKLSLIDQGESYLQIRSIGIGESALETELRPLFDQHEQLAVAYSLTKAKSIAASVFQKALNEKKSCIKSAKNADACSERIFSASVTIHYQKSS